MWSWPAAPSRRTSRRLAERRLPDTPVLPVPDVADSAELLLLTVPDSELAGLVAAWRPPASVRRGTIVVHTSGANGIGIAGPADRAGLHPAGHPSGDDVHRRRRGHRPAVRHLLRDHRRRRDRLRDRPVAGAGDRRRAVPGPRGRPHALSRGAGPRQQPRRHRASPTRSTRCAPRCRARNCWARRLVGDAPGGLAERIIGPLARAALENTLQRGQAALTGPVARGDAAAVAAPPARTRRSGSRTGAGVLRRTRCAPRNERTPPRRSSRCWRTGRAEEAAR